MTFKPFATETPGRRGETISSFLCFVFLCALCVSVVSPTFAKDAAPLAEDPSVAERFDDPRDPMR